MADSHDFEGICEARRKRPADGGRYNARQSVENVDS